MDLFITVFAKEFAFLAIGCMAGLAIVRKKSIPCNSCRYLVRRGGGIWRYTCKPKGELEECFDTPPKYCNRYKRREEEE